MRKKATAIGLSLALMSAGTVAHAQVTQQWVQLYRGGGDPTRGDVATAMAVDGFGNVFVTGSSWNGTNYDYATVAYDSSGTQLWAARYDAGGDDRALAIALGGFGNIYVTGQSVHAVTRVADYATVAYDSHGNELWVARYPEGTPRAIALDGFGNVYVTGQSRNLDPGGCEFAICEDFLTVAYDSSGNPLWVARYHSHGPGGGAPTATGIAADVTGHVYVTGLNFTSARRYQYATVAYDGSGNRLWEALYDGPGNGDDMPAAIAIDSVGNVYVTGTSWGGVTSSNDYATVAYDFSGSQRWVARYNGPANDDDTAIAIAVDDAGGVYVTGLSWGGATSYDYATVAYNPNGTQRWVARYNGPGNNWDEPTGIAVDGTGGVYVTGYSFNIATIDYATLKYNVFSGARQWEARYARGKANAIAVNGFDVYVTGAGFFDTGDEYTTIKYSQP